MDWLNYHHLYYFWVVAREGGLTPACRKLRLAKPTVSGQIRRLEEVLNEKLFEKKGRKLVLTEMGRMVFQYAEEIFSTGQELLEAVAGKKTNRPFHLRVGIAGVLPKTVVHSLLEPAFHLNMPVSIACNEDRSVSEFVAQLGLHELDVVLSDSPAGPITHKKVYSHLLGECGTTFFAKTRVANRLKKGFPKSLTDQPCLLPSPKSMLRRSLDLWFHDHSILPAVIGEFDNPAMMNVFGQSGLGFFPGPTLIENEMLQRYRVGVVGRVKDLRQSFYAISAESRLSNPATLAICESARRDLFRST